MKFSLAALRGISHVEIAVIASFVLFLVLPVKIPLGTAAIVNSSIGLLVIFCTTVFLFVYTTPILGALFVFVGYELIRRSAIDVAYTPRADLVQFTQTAATAEERDRELRQMNPPAQVSLEEDVIAAMAPIGRSDPASFINTSFKPVACNLHNASPL